MFDLFCKHQYVCDNYKPPFPCIGDQGYVIKCRKCGKVKRHYESADSFINIGDVVKTNSQYDKLIYNSGTYEKCIYWKNFK